ncbi:MAG: hypothetical protein ABL959_11965, partial [Pyrinomonadaceae bacterium]
DGKLNARTPGAFYHKKRKSAVPGDQAILHSVISIIAAAPFVCKRYAVDSRHEQPYNPSVRTQTNFRIFA